MSCSQEASQEAGVEGFLLVWVRVRCCVLCVCVVRLWLLLCLCVVLFVGCFGCPGVGWRALASWSSTLEARLSGGKEGCMLCFSLEHWPLRFADGLCRASSALHTMDISYVATYVLGTICTSTTRKGMDAKRPPVLAKPNLPPTYPHLHIHAHISNDNHPHSYMHA